MKLNITDHWAALVQDDTLIQNFKKPYEVEFTFDKTWDGFSKTAIFEAGAASIVIALTSDRCYIPSECLKRGGVNLRVGVYGVKGKERKATVWCPTSRILYDINLDVGHGSSGSGGADEVYTEIMAAIGDLSAAGFEGKNLAEVLREVKDSIAETATDAEVDSVLDAAFGESGEDPGDPVEPEDPSNTATDEEVDDILNDVFG